jgi:non-heme chloroperoxidase
MPKITMRDGYAIHVRELGTGSTPVILLHGFGMQSMHWLPFALPLANKFRFIIPDLRGFGHSHLSPHNQECVISNYADDLADLVEHYQLTYFKLAGISMGAFAALQYQKKYGDQKVVGYMHIDQGPITLNNEEWSWGIFGHDNVSRLKKAEKLVNKLMPYIEKGTVYSALPKNLTQELWQNLGDFFSSALSKPSHKSLAIKACRSESLIKKIMPTENWPAYIICLKSYLENDYNMFETFEQLNTPVSLLVGLKSEMYPCGGQLRIADHTKNCEVIPFTNSGHTPLIDQPFKFIKELRRFSAA